MSNDDILLCIYGAVVLLAFIVGYLTGRNRGYNKGWAIGFDTRSSIMDAVTPNASKALARIAHSDAQNGEDAMRMRDIATAFIYPAKAHLYDNR